jgi:hypothetical protein
MPQSSVSANPTGKRPDRLFLASRWLLLRLGRASVMVDGAYRAAEAATASNRARSTRKAAFFEHDRRSGGGQVARGFVRGTDGRTIYVFVCPIMGKISYVGYDRAPSASALG